MASAKWRGEETSDERREEEHGDEEHGLGRKRFNLC
jgi:hypothetical protein